MQTSTIYNHVRHHTAAGRILAALSIYEEIDGRVGASATILENIAWTHLRVAGAHRGA